jgi:hypothetical protein
MSPTGSTPNLLQQFESVHALNHVNHSPDSDVGLTILLYNLKTMENSVVDLTSTVIDNFTQEGPPDIVSF